MMVSKKPHGPNTSHYEPKASHNRTNASPRWGSHWLRRFCVVCVNFIRVGYTTRTQFSVEYGLLGLQSLTIQAFIHFHVKHCELVIKEFHKVYIYSFLRKQTKTN